MRYDQFFAGEYQIERTLQRSQYSVLCQGKAASNGQPVLLKLWLTAQAVSEEEQTRIHEEVAAWQNLNHPNLSPVLRVQADAQKVFLVSEYMPGGSLNERLAREDEPAISLDEALKIIEQTGRALEELHAHTIIHGNLTPQAIFFDEQGLVKLSEFLVRSVLVTIQDYQHILDEDAPRCLYMAPEQFHGALDVKTDQYALGCLAYLLLTGRIPFAGSTRSVLLQKHECDHPTDLTALNPAVPTYIETAVLTALAKDPSERHSSIGTFLEALDASGQKVLADQNTTKHVALVSPTPETEDIASWNTIKQAVPGTLFLTDEDMVDGSWEWEVAVPPEGPLEDSGPTRAVRTGGSSHSPLLVQFPGVQPNTTQTASAQKRRAWYVLIPAIFLVCALVFTAGRWFLVPTGSNPSHAISNVNRLTTPTSVLLTPATATSAQATATAAVVSVQLPTSTPTPQPTPDPGATATPTPAPNATPTPAPLLTIAPIFNCVRNEGKSFLAYFGYDNANSYAVTIPVGANNSVSPSHFNGQQITTFSPGTQNNVFQVNAPNNEFITWTIDGHQAWAWSKARPC